MINVSLHDARQYAAWLSRKTGRSYRLLSEAEWEYAARAGTSTQYSFGDDVEYRFGTLAAILGNPIDRFAWHLHNSEIKTHPVGEKKANPWGLFDMHGNVWEQVEDCWVDNYMTAPTDASAQLAGCLNKENPPVDEWPLHRRVIRGGGWQQDGLSARSAARRYQFSHQRSDDVGFRVARMLP